MAKNQKSDKIPVFIKEYLVDFNGTQAAIRAGYSKKTAGSQAHDLLKKPEICAAIKAEQEARAQRTDISIDRIVLEYKRLALFDIRKAFDENGVLKPPSEWDDDTAAAIAGLEAEEIYAGAGEDRQNIGRLSKVKLSDKRAALSDLMRHLGGFEKDNQQQNGAAEAQAALDAIRSSKTTEERNNILKNLLT